MHNDYNLQDWQRPIPAWNQMSWTPRQETLVQRLVRKLKAIVLFYHVLSSFWCHKLFFFGNDWIHRTNSNSRSMPCADRICCEVVATLRILARYFWQRNQISCCSAWTRNKNHVKFDWCMSSKQAVRCRQWSVELTTTCVLSSCWRDSSWVGEVLAAVELPDMADTCSSPLPLHA